MKTQKHIPLAFILTCRTYASWVHGDARGSVDPKHNKFLTPRLKPNNNLKKIMQDNCTENMFLMNAPQRQTVLESIINTCKFAGWHLHAAHVRSNHLHVVLNTEKEIEKVSISLKAYATRYLKKEYPELQRERFWSSGSSTGYIFRSDYLLRAIEYTIEDQGKHMAFYCEKEYYRLFHN
ncbi:MAG: transposase [Gammaproteobacteria bacterium]|nr:transposase [Gammaproteobacteria bacterium]